MNMVELDMYETVNLSSEPSDLSSDADDVPTRRRPEDRQLQESEIKNMIWMISHTQPQLQTHPTSHTPQVTPHESHPTSHTPRVTPHKYRSTPCVHLCIQLFTPII